MIGGGGMGGECERNTIFLMGGGGRKTIAFIIIWNQPFRQTLKRQIEIYSLRRVTRDRE